jgi:hypothetical protein
VRDEILAERQRSSRSDDDICCDDGRRLHSGPGRPACPSSFGPAGGAGCFSWGGRVDVIVAYFWMSLLFLGSPCKMLTFVNLTDTTASVEFLRRYLIFS